MLKSACKYNRAKEGEIYLKCNKCGATCQSGDKICGECGSNLESQAINVSQPAQEETTTTHPTPNNSSAIPQSTVNNQEYIDKGKVISKMYFSYFLTMLKNPVSAAANTNKHDLTNGLITMVLFTLSIPLMFFFALKNTLDDYLTVSFFDVVMKPFFVFFIYIVLVVAVVLGVLKIAKSSANFLDVMARLGSFLVLPTAFLAVAFILSLIGSTSCIFFLSIGLICFSVIIPLIIYSYKQEEPGGLDTFYCILLTYVGIAIIFLIVGEQVVQDFIELLDNPYGYYDNPWNY